MKKRKILSICILLILVIGIIYISFPNKNNKTVNKSKSINTFTDASMITLMIEKEAGSGEYEQSSNTTWPEGSYDINEEMSKCENGGKLTFDKSTKKVTLKTNISDKCYVYFDKVADLFITPTYKETTGVPTTVGLQATLSCNGTTSTYNNQYNRIEVSGISTAKATCNLTYADRTSKTYLNNKIISLSGTTQGTGQVVNENGYRYEGKDPNNYIWFNNELWRIIGVFDSTSHGQSGQNLVKIIRGEPLGSYVWDNLGKNNWSTSSLKSLLNGAYYNQQDGTQNEYCYVFGYSSIKGNCDYRQNGIDRTYRSMIKKVTWYLGGFSSTEISPLNMLSYEIDTTSKYSSNPASDTGYIGLMYASDYGYSVIESNDCPRGELLSLYNTSACAGQSWLYGKGVEWTITPSSNNSNMVFLVNYSGSVNNGNLIYGYEAIPVLYLDSSVYYVDGNGTINNPYIIGM